MMKNSFLIVLVLPLLIQAKIDPSIELVFPEIIKDYPSLRDFSINEDQDEAYFTAQSVLQEVSVIMQITKRNGKWGKPQIASFSGEHHDLEAFISSDGLKLYFASKRPNSFTEKDNYDIWYVERKNSKESWSKPQNMGSNINSKHNEFYPSVANNKNLYFTSNKDDSKGKDDIYFSEFKNNHYQPSYSISESINTKGDEYNAFIAPDESYLLFGAFGRSDSIGSGDLYISYMNKDRSWSPAQILSKPINSKYMDYCPFVINDSLYFTSRRSHFDVRQFKNSKHLIKELNKADNGLVRLYKTSLSKALPEYQSHLKPSFLIGKWKVKGKSTYEQWDLDDSLNLIGSSYKLIDGKKDITETIQITQKDNDFIYSATVKKQNDGKTIDFNLNNEIFDKYVFENMNHDFPNIVSYEKKTNDHLLIDVRDKNGKGFSYDLFRHQEKKEIPEWFLSDLEKNIGIWTADNSAYQSAKEKQQKYEMKWQWGIGKTSITGRLYGYIDNKKTQDYWHFRQYWDNVENKAMLVQYGNGGMYGIGEIKNIEDQKLEIIQTFSNSFGKTWQTRHISQNDGKSHNNSSWKQNKNGSWKLDRNYIWYKSDE